MERTSGPDLLHWRKVYLKEEICQVMKSYVLGLDLGPNSIGWAMLQLGSDGETPIGFADTRAANHPPMGVRVFEAGIKNFDSSKEESLNQTRRRARSMRRSHFRRNQRRARFKHLLIEAGLLPEDDEKLKEVYASDPYSLRARALVEDLDPFEVGRALYHLAQRRGFKSIGRVAMRKRTERYSRK